MSDHPRARRMRLAVSAVSLFAIGFAVHCGDRRGALFGEEPCNPATSNACDPTCTDGVACDSGTIDTTDSSNSFDFDGGITNPNDGAPSPDACADVDVTLAKITPTVLVLIDQSQSMSDYQFPEGSGITRWDALRSALIDPDGGIVKRLENDVSFGVSLYSWEDQPLDPRCPMTVDVPWKISNYQSIYDVYADAGTSDNTPTAESIMSVVGFDDAGVIRDGGFASASTPGPKILVLATDGDPDTCADRDSNGQPGPRNFTVWATARTYDAGIPTYVISVGTDIDQAHQQQVANVGQGLAANAPDAAAVYRPTDKQQLVDALNKVILGVRSCKFTLNGSVALGTESQGSVKLNGVSLGYGDANGWKLNSATELELVGAACTTLQTTFDAQVSVRFPCGTFTPPIPK